jgi:Flp pilus assembly pilin Flp
VEEYDMRELAKRLWQDESGQGLAEYALLLGLIVIGVVVLIQGMGISIQKIFTKANTDLGTAASGLP